MFKLMKLEIRKFKIKGYVKGAFIATLSIFGFLFLISYVERDLSSYGELFEVMGTIINCTFMIFAGVLLARIIIDEFKNKTINVLFGYPISRKRLMLAKILIVVLFTFFSIVLSFILIFLGFYIIQIIHPIIQDRVTFELVSNQLISTVSSAVMTSIMSLIPLYFGLRKKSIPTTIVTSIIIALLLNSNNGGATLSSITIIPIIFAVVGAILTYLATIKDIENKDVKI